MDRLVADGLKAIRRIVVAVIGGTVLLLGLALLVRAFQHGVGFQRHGQLGFELEPHLGVATLEQVEAWSSRVLTAASLEELFVSRYGDVG